MVLLGISKSTFVYILLICEIIERGGNKQYCMKKSLDIMKENIDTILNDIYLEIVNEL